MKKPSKPKQLRLSRQTVRALSTPALDGVRGGVDIYGSNDCERYTSACAQSDRCYATH